MRTASDVAELRYCARKMLTACGCKNSQRPARLPLEQIALRHRLAPRVTRKGERVVQDTGRRDAGQIAQDEGVYQGAGPAVQAGSQGGAAGASAVLPRLCTCLLVLPTQGNFEEAEQGYKQQIRQLEEQVERLKVRLHKFSCLPSLTLCVDLTGQVGRDGAHLPPRAAADVVCMARLVNADDARAHCRVRDWWDERRRSAATVPAAELAEPAEGEGERQGTGAFSRRFSRSRRLISVLACSDKPNPSPASSLYLSRLRIPYSSTPQHTFAAAVLQHRSLVSPSCFRFVRVPGGSAVTVLSLKVCAVPVRPPGRCTLRVCESTPSPPSSDLGTTSSPRLDPRRRAHTPPSAARVSPAASTAPRQTPDTRQRMRHLDSSRRRRTSPTSRHPSLHTARGNAC